jgi:hypothetical protein
MQPPARAADSDVADLVEDGRIVGFNRPTGATTLRLSRSAMPPLPERPALPSPARLPADPRDRARPRRRTGRELAEHALVPGVLVGLSQRPARRPQGLGGGDEPSGRRMVVLGRRQRRGRLEALRQAVPVIELLRDSQRLVEHGGGRARRRGGRAVSAPASATTSRGRGAFRPREPPPAPPRGRDAERAAPAGDTWSLGHLRAVEWIGEGATVFSY